MNDIFQVLDVSTRHLPFELRFDLDTIGGVLADHRGAGWFVYVPKDIDTTTREVDEPIPEPIVGLWRYAARRGCQYVLLDPDGALHPELPTYDEKEPGLPRRGAPYALAEVVQVDGPPRAAVRCPVCDEVIAAPIGGDFKAATRLYAAHYIDTHETETK